MRSSPASPQHVEKSPGVGKRFDLAAGFVEINRAHTDLLDLRAAAAGFDQDLRFQVEAARVQACGLPEIQADQAEAALRVAEA